MCSILTVEDSLRHGERLDGDSCLPIVVGNRIDLAFCHCIKSRSPNTGILIKRTAQIADKVVMKTILLTVILISCSSNTSPDDTIETKNSGTDISRCCTDPTYECTMSRESYAEMEANLKAHCGKLVDAVEKCDETKCADRDELKANQVADCLHRVQCQHWLFLKALTARIQSLKFSR